MDSRLLDVLHDGNYGPFGGSDSHIWSSSSESMGLDETLHGILPMEPMKLEEQDMPYGSFVKNEILDERDDIMTQMLSYDGNTNEANAFNNITVEKYDADDYECVSQRNKYVIDMDNLADLDDLSEFSSSTFRSRTDSSSIGDYESHTSDYEDMEETKYQTNEHNDDINQQEDDMDTVQEFIDEDLAYTDEIVVENASFDVSTFASDQFVLDLFQNEKEILNVLNMKKERTISTNTVDSDIAGLGIKIGSNFDLTEFITNDDDANTDEAPAAITEQAKTTLTTISETSKEDTDVDTDEEFVDIETVESDPKLFLMATKTMQEKQQQVKLESEMQNLNVPEEVPYVDNVKNDPSWKPKAGECKLKTTKSQQKQKPPAVEKTKKPCAKSKTALKRITNPVTPKKLPNGSKQVATAPPAPAATQITPKVQGKNMEKLKAQIPAVTKVSPKKSNPIITNIKVEYVDPKVKKEPTAIVAGPEHKTALPPALASASAPESDTKPAPLKRKLNLEEYKQRRGCTQGASKTLIQVKSEKPVALTATSAAVSPAIATTTTTTTISMTPTTPNILKSPVKHSQEVVSIVKSLKEDQVLLAATDPITMARNKVLRMKELKKARAIKIIDSRIAAKVPRVTKLLPLKEIVKDTCYTQAVAADDDDSHKPFVPVQSQFEAKTYVSVAANTDVTIPAKTAKKVNSRSLLKSNVLLQNINNTMEQVQETAKEVMQIAKTTSLFSSIQQVVEKSTFSDIEIKLNPTQPPNPFAEQHGEDKIIMHLRKDRIRNKTASTGTQTEFLVDFPLLQWKPMPRHYRRQNAHGNEHSESEAEEICSTISKNSSSSPQSSKRHRSSISSSYSEHERERMSRARQQKRTMRKKKYSHNSASSSSDSEHSEYNAKRSQSRSCSRSRSRSNSRSSYHRYRSRSRSPSLQRSRFGYNNNNNNNNNKKHFHNRNVPKPAAVEERRIVYVGRIEEETTKEMLRRKFIRYGTIKSISVHYKENGMKYGFVTFESPQDAFTVIENGTKDSQINIYDLSFGGRRAFCRTSYSDLDNAGINTYQSIVFPQPVVAPKEDDSFEALLLKVKAKLNAKNNTDNNSKDSNNKNTDKAP